MQTRSPPEKLSSHNYYKARPSYLTHPFRYRCVAVAVFPRFVVDTNDLVNRTLETCFDLIRRCSHHFTDVSERVSVHQLVNDILLCRCENSFVNQDVQIKKRVRDRITGDIDANCRTYISSSERIPCLIIERIESAPLFNQKFYDARL